VAAGLAGAALVAGCGGDDNGSSDTVERVYRAPTAGQTTPEDVPVNPAPSTPSTTTEPQQSPGEGDGTGPQESPGEGNGTGGGGGSGGGGGTEPARTELTFSATSAGVTPLRAGVAPYISVKVSLVSKDGSAHTLTINGQTVTVGPDRKSASFTLAGLRPGKHYAGTADGKPVRIDATSEPGP
jgi:hypothetical protein